jgi:putative spermidine/putrescine transport system permease protein
MTATLHRPERASQAPALRHRLAERGVDRQLLLLAPAVLFVALLFLYPFFYGLQLSVAP